MKAIPFLPDPGVWDDLQASPSSFVEIVSNERYEVRMQYPLRGMRHAEKRCLVRKEVCQRLLDAHGFLPRGYRFLIFDAWRPFDLQKELYDKYKEEILTRFHAKENDASRQEALISRFISLPVKNRLIPPVHTTGGAIDLTVLDETGAELDMGCGFDSFEDMAHTAFFENGQNETVRENRRLLYGAMTRAGFTNLPSEWWHYDYGDRFWGFYTQASALYPGCFDASELAIKPNG